MIGNCYHKSPNRAITFFQKKLLTYLLLSTFFSQIILFICLWQSHSMKFVKQNGVSPNMVLYNKFSID